MKESLNIGIIGLGARTMGLLKLAILKMKDVRVIALCDLYPDRVEQAQNLIFNKTKVRAEGFSDYKDFINFSKNKIDCVIIATSWKSHAKISIACLENGIPVGAEVGGAFSIDECWELVNAYEKIKTPFMFLENCCYGKYELSCLAMKNEGIFGEIVACECAYRHDLREEISNGEKNRHYRLQEYIDRNCENYPTHGIGPVAKLLDLGHGNRMETLVSFTSQSKGLKNYISKNLNNPDLAKLQDIVFKQADIVHTLIKCHNGELIKMTLDTTLPRFYSRGLVVNGTNAMYQEDGNIFFNDQNKRHKIFHYLPSRLYNNGKWMTYKYKHPIWRNFRKKTAGHGGMDWLVLRAFFESIKNGEKIMPIDVYDAVSWMVISVLSEESIKNGNKVVEFPDFTNGKWNNKKIKNDKIYYI